MQLPPIIGLGYKAGAGKDTVASILAERDTYTMSFADPLKQAARVVFELTDEQLYGRHKESLDKFWNTTPRSILQRLGTEAMRQTFGPDIWIRVMRRKIDKVRETYKDVESTIVIPDVRFTNEAEAIHAWGGVVWRIDRNSAGAKNGEPLHKSEHELDNWQGWDAVIDNNGTLTDLRTTIVNLLDT